MMELLDTIPMDVHFILRVSGTELEYIYTALKKTSLSFDNADEDMVKAINFLTESFIPFIASLIERGDQDGS